MESVHIVVFIYIHPVRIHCSQLKSLIAEAPLLSNTVPSRHPTGIIIVIMVALECRQYLPYPLIGNLRDEKT